ncbi:AraC family transcriptional regulator [Halalkalibacter sp. APA_J-10(15)]|uniref:AraC family transcriptional regulator n=1 Tax=unclassified Halalkalibacter TaxID=2893063 RepID=UPI001FF60AC9|nr:AraC family transcriptional regulator [Halalkalibacter sp. APA_J-10(15)]MCK0470500.1 AraC family transcriptional regulator [Halalkalibacter sp. APA_J-10(15)]
MDSLKRMNEAISYIEANLTESMDLAKVAQLAHCSEYHFKRMFSFLADITLSEYIRRRRLTLAAFDLKHSNDKVIDIALRYGYSSPDAFTRAFHSIHGVTPTDARNNGSSLKAYPRMTFQLSIQGGTEMNYRLEQKEAFRIVGLKERVQLAPTGDNPQIVKMVETTSDETYSLLEQLSNVSPSGVINVCANYSEEDSSEGELDYYLAAATTKPCPPHLSELHIPRYTWAIFEIEGDWSQVQTAWGQIYSEWFPTSGYEHAGGPEILASANEKSEIWIPVIKK